MKKSMQQPLTLLFITHRPALRFVITFTFIIYFSFFVEAQSLAPAKTKPSLHVYDSYGWLRGLGMVPSWGARIEDAWWFYDGAKMREEIALARQIHVNCIRLWIEFTAWQRDPDKVTANFMDAVAAIAENGMKVMPCLFNRWHDSQFDYGGTYLENIRPGWRQPLDYVKVLVTPLAADDRILAWYLCNEPQATDLKSEPNQREFQWLSEIAATVRGCGARQPILIGTMQGEGHIRTLAPLVDVLCAHPYHHRPEQLAKQIEPYQRISRDLGKPLLVNETIPGCLDDAKRAEVVKFYTEQLSTAGFGWMGWVIREGRAISTRRDRYDGNGINGQGFHPFFTKEGKLRGGLEFLTAKPKLLAPWEIGGNRGKEAKTTIPPDLKPKERIALNKSRINEYSWVRGFNYQPSWGSHGITIWNDFREGTFTKEVELGRKHFPKLNTLRIWFSYDAYIADPKRFLAAVKRAAEILAERKIKMIPVFFNGWHSLVDFGGFSREQLFCSIRNQPSFGPHRQYLCELIQAIKPAGNLLMYDLANEPFNNGGKEKGSIELKFLEAMARQIRELDSKTPISVGTQGCPGVGGPDDLDLIDSFVDVHAVHPYWIPSIPAEKHAENFAKMIEHLKRLGKPAIATECCWGTNDDTTRVKYIRHDLSLLKQADIGFLPHALHHSPVADLHRPVPGRRWQTMYMVSSNRTARFGRDTRFLMSFDMNTRLFPLLTGLLLTMFAPLYATTAG